MGVFKKVCQNQKTIFEMIDCQCLVNLNLSLTLEFELSQKCPLPYSRPPSMKFTPKILSLILIILSFSFLWMMLKVSIPEKFENAIPAESLNEKLIPSEYFYAQRAYPHNRINKAAYKKALNYRTNTPKKNRQQSPWEFAGPFNIGGRVTDVEMFEDDLNTVFVSTASGGIFKSLDSGDSWFPIFDEVNSLSIGDLAIAKDRTIYVGTGEANAGGGSLAYDGLGVYRSLDEGTTWESKGLTDVGSIGQVVVNPDNSDEVFVAAMGYLFENNSERGVYRSEDGGDSWEQVLFVSDSTGAIDLVIHPSNPDILYAAMWERIRRPQFRQYGGITSGIYKSEDGGDTWEELTNGLPIAANLKGRIGLAIAPSNPNTVMAIYADSFGNLEGIFKSTNSGESWERVGNVGSVPFMWWFGKIFIDPINENTVFTPALDLYRSRDGGQSFQNSSDGMHVDQHALFIHPLNTNFIVAGNDGGVYISENGGTNWTKKNTLPITQFYTCEIDFSQPERLYGGTQDNGTIRTITGQLADWQPIFGGDGFRVLVDPLNNQFVYAEAQRGAFGRSTNGGISFQSARNGIVQADRNNWNTPVAFDPNQPSTLFLGTQRVYKSTDRAINWTPISPDLSNGSGGGNINFGTLTTLDVSTINSAIIYAGTDDGNVWNTLDGGATWNNLSANLPNRWVTDVATDPLDVATAYAIYSGYRFGENQGHVFKTEDNGQNWVDLSSSLPDIPLNAIIINPNNTEQLFVASDIGVFESINGGLDWELLIENLPNVPVTDLDFHEPTNALIAATYGRGLYRYNLTNSTTAIANTPKLNFEVKLYPNPTRSNLQIEFELKERTPLSIFLTDISQRRLQTILEVSKNRGIHQVSTNLDNFATGHYFLVIKTKEQQQAFKVEVISN